MVKVVAKIFIQEGQLDQALALYSELVQLTREEQGCVAYELHQDSKDKHILAMIETWENREALDAHLTSEHFMRIVPSIKPLLAKDTEMNIYHVLI